MPIDEKNTAEISRAKLRVRVLELYALGGEPHAIARSLGVPPRTARAMIMKATNLPANFYEAKLLACARAVRRGAHPPLKSVHGLYTRKRRVRSAPAAEKDQPQ